MASSKLRKENEVFSEHFADLCYGITDIDSLLPHFVTERIINANDVEQINAKVTTTDKMKALISHISSPLHVGYNKPFESMLQIMEEYGNITTQKIAKNIKSK